MLAWLVAAVDLFVVRDGDAPVHADAVVVLSGASERLPVGIRLVRDGYAPLLVVSRSRHPAPLEVQACAGSAGVIAYCAAADPYSTRGEARLIARLAQERSWHSVDVVTSRFHVFRAKRMIERCYDGALRVVAAPNPAVRHLAWNFVLETGKVVVHEVDRRC